MSAVPKAVPSAIAFSASDSVQVDTEPQLQPYEPMSGSSVIATVPRSDDIDESNLTGQPRYGRATGTGSQPGGSPSAPSVPRHGWLFTARPIDPHYMNESEGRSPYAKINNPPTRGMLTWVKSFANHVFNGTQDTDSAGWQQNSPQQRTSYMRITPPPHADGYSPEPSAPRQLPQTPATQRFLPHTGTDPYGTGVLNSDTYGAGQTAGGLGGSSYTPPPGPPDTNLASGADGSGMPVWG